MSGRITAAPCGHTGETIIGNYVKCLAGCDSVKQPKSTQVVSNVPFKSKLETQIYAAFTEITEVDIRHGVGSVTVYIRGISGTPSGPGWITYQDSIRFKLYQWLKTNLPVGIGYSAINRTPTYCLDWAVEELSIRMKTVGEPDPYGYVVDHLANVSKFADKTLVAIALLYIQTPTRNIFELTWKGEKYSEVLTV